MSRAFVREPDHAKVPEDLPEWPVSEHPNFVTARGLRQIETRIHALESESARRDDDEAAAARLRRDLRYWLQRRSNATLIESDAQPSTVRFGVRVTVRYDDGEERSYTLVGEDEADPAQGYISWISPLAQLLTGAQPGDEMQLQGRRADVLRLG